MTSPSQVRNGQMASRQLGHSIPLAQPAASAVARIPDFATSQISPLRRQVALQQRQDFAVRYGERAVQHVAQFGSWRNAHRLKGATWGHCAGLNLRCDFAQIVGMIGLDLERNDSENGSSGSVRA